MHISSPVMTFKSYLYALSAIIISVRKLRCQVSAPANVWRRRGGARGSLGHSAWLLSRILGLCAFLNEAREVQRQEDTFPDSFEIF